MSAAFEVWAGIIGFFIAGGLYAIAAAINHHADTSARIHNAEMKARQ